MLQGVQVVYLTAILPPQDKKKFYELTYIPWEHKPIRNRTTQLNIRYQVQSIKISINKEVEDILGQEHKEKGYNPIVVAKVIDIIKAKYTQYIALAKIVVYYSNRIASKKLAEAIGCNIYHYNINTKDRKA